MRIARIAETTPRVEPTWLKQWFAAVTNAPMMAWASASIRAAPLSLDALTGRERDDARVLVSLGLQLLLRRDRQHWSAGTLSASVCFTDRRSGRPLMSCSIVPVSWTATL
jgi:hypothetical protein